ncbi:MAG: hypothetical protein DRJ42_02520 [Deltaproteobacteria bacterium]|nr:MAG: hypothetical protein DRJ42_02520 [Deltaproteobacteria bacterium]
MGPREGQERPRSAQVLEAGDAPPASAPSTEAATILLEGDGDIDGVPGDEHLVLRTDGTLEAGAWRGRAEVFEMIEYWAERQATVGVVVLDRRRGLRGVLVTLPIAEHEDPPNRYQLFVPDGADALRSVLDITPGAYGGLELSFPGDGTVGYLEDGWSACDRLNEPRSAPRQRITFAMDGDQMVERDRRESGQVQVCDMLAACPYVYVLGAGDPVLAGEILRNLRGSAAYAEQSLSVAGAAGTPLHIRLAEEKPEVTYLDAVYVEDNGVRVSPRSCTEAFPGPAYCIADGIAFVLRQGDTLDLTFDAPGTTVELRATGYYVPTSNLREP